MHTYQKIYQTSDFGKFKYFSGNRNINKYHVEKIKQSILRDSRLHLHPIIVVEEKNNLYVCDGQHRLEACKELNIPVHYVINDNPNSNSIIDDQISKSWELIDYLKYYLVKDFEEYIKIKKLMDLHEIPFYTIYYLLGSQKYENAKLFKEGKIKINQKIENFLNEIDDFYKYSMKTYPNAKTILHRRDFVASLFWFYKNFPPQFKKLVEYLKNIFPEIPDRGTRTSYEHFLIAKSNIVKIGNKGIKHPKKIEEQ